MKFIAAIVLIIIGYSNLFSQDLPPEVHRNDSVWIQDVQIGIDVYVKFKIHLLKFKNQELQSLMENLDSALITDLSHIDKVYKTELNNFKTGYSEFMLNNQDKLYGYTYLDMVIEFEKFLVYPNIYGILLNPVRLSVNPKIDKPTKEISERLVNKIYESVNMINPKKLEEIKMYILEFEEQVPDRFHRINQGDLSDTEKMKYRIIDFLVLMNRQF